MSDECNLDVELTPIIIFGWTDGLVRKRELQLTYITTMANEFQSKCMLKNCILAIFKKGSLKNIHSRLKG